MRGIDAFRVTLHSYLASTIAFDTRLICQNYVRRSFWHEQLLLHHESNQHFNNIMLLNSTFYNLSIDI